MTKSQLIARIADRFPQLVAKDSQVAVELILSAIGESLTQGRRAEIRGFGSFTLHHRPARLARNPKTGEAIPVPEKSALHYRPGKPLLEYLQSQSGR